MLKRYILVATLFTVGVAQAQLISRKEIDPVSLIPPSPEVGSYDEVKDFEIMTVAHAARSMKDCEKAQRDANLSPRFIFGAASAVLTDRDVQEVQSVIDDAANTTQYFTNILKERYKRARPYVREPEKFRTCIGGHSSYSYPSGHASIAMAYALALAELYPEKRAVLLQRAEDYGWQRVMGGVHFPSDVRAGQDLALRIHEKLMKKPAFVARIRALKDKRHRELSSDK